MTSFQTFFFFLLFSFFSFSLFSYPVLAESGTNNLVVIINQVRGEDCCSAGSVESTKSQLDTISRLGLKASFAIRYDALTDKRYTDLLKSYIASYPALISPSGMIEIIPTLAQDAGVTYNGNSENWYHAQYAFTVGYEKADRKKIVDTYMAKYLSIFGSYPSTTSSWMIDTESANYMHEVYGVVAHQLTREQWGVDSYTLHGGSFHYPYPASNKWIFLPDYGQKNPLIMLRQTVTDPLYNYGDTSSVFTSQPNDYMRAGRDISYFATLLTNAMTQPRGQVGFALLGLENSMNAEYQNAYALQLAWLAENLSSLEASNVLPSDRSIVELAKSNSVSLYYGKNGDEEAWNITTDKYRVRLISKKSGTFITDLRYYSNLLDDPYTSRVAKHEAFWVAPFVIDGSRWYKPKYGYNTEHAFMSPYNDFGSVPSRLVVSTKQSVASTKIVKNDIVLTTEDGAIVARFSDQDFELAGQPILTQEVPSAYPVFYTAPSKNSAGAIGIKYDSEIKSKFDISCTDTCLYSRAKPENSDVSLLSDMYDRMYPYYYPEPVGRKLNPVNSKIKILNKFAIAGRNPVRVILEPHDDMNFQILLQSNATIIPNNENVYVMTIGDLKSSHYQYVDFYSNTPLHTIATAAIGDTEPYFSKQLSMYFAPNCKLDLAYCVLHPLQGSWYAATKISDWWSGRR